jgi:hypothetical protein
VRLFFKMVVQDIYRDEIAEVSLDGSLSFEFLGAVDVVGEKDNDRVKVELEERADVFRIKNGKFKQFASSSDSYSSRIIGRVYGIPDGVDFVDVEYWKYDNGVVYEVNGYKINPSWEYEQIERRARNGF